MRESLKSELPLICESSSRDRRRRRTHSFPVPLSCLFPSPRSRGKNISSTRPNYGDVLPKPCLFRLIDFYARFKLSRLHCACKFSPHPYNILYRYLSCIAYSPVTRLRLSILRELQMALLTFSEGATVQSLKLAATRVATTDLRIYFSFTYHAKITRAAKTWTS